MHINYSSPIEWQQTHPFPPPNPNPFNLHKKSSPSDEEETPHCDCRYMLLQTMCNIEKMKTEERFEEMSNSELLERLHAENINTLNEVVLSYRAVMTTAKFLKILAHHFKKTKDPERKFDYLLTFKEWVEKSTLYMDDYKEEKITKRIATFLKLAKASYGSNVLHKIERQIREVQLRAASPPRPGKRTMSSLHEVTMAFNGNIDLLSREFKALSLELQSRIRADLFAHDNSAEVRTVISTINNQLKNQIIADINSEENIDGQIERYLFYIELSKESMAIGDLLTCIAFFGAFYELAKTELGHTKQVRKYAPYVEELTIFAGDKSGSKARNQLLSDKALPINFIQFFNQCEMLKAAAPRLIDSASGSQVANARYIAAIALLTNDLAERQKCTYGSRPLTNLSQLLLPTEPAH
jgi:hypothetical protein